jgi:LCP family protein required for cell wall assembly
MKIIALCIVLLLSAVPACIPLFGISADRTATATIFPAHSATVPRSTATRTATLTATPEPSATPTLTPTPTATPIYLETIDPALPSPVPLIRDKPRGEVNLLLLGSDYRPESGYRTDVIVLLSISTLEKTVTAISFPRDLYLAIPGWTTQRINTAKPHGGFEMIADTLEYNFGIRPDHYIQVDFDGFKRIVNNLGGINVHVGSYLSDRCDLPQSRGGACAVEPGSVAMDGATALWYVRSRATSGDLDRMRRGQEVLTAIFSKLIGLDGLTRLPELYDLYIDSVETDLTLKDLVPLTTTAGRVVKEPDRIRRFAISNDEVEQYRTEQGWAVLMPDFDAIHALLEEAMQTK